MIKICKCCGKEFETNKSYKEYCDRPHYLPCPVCGKPVLKPDKDFSRPPKCCSNECTHKLRKQHFKKKKCVLCGEWFTPTTGSAKQCSKQHFRKCDICGKEYPYSLTENKDQKTCSIACSKEKLRRFYRDKYGVDFPMQSEIVQQHHRESMKSKYGVEFALQDKEFVEKQQKSVIHTNLAKHGVPYACLLPQCAEAQGKIISNVNKHAAELVQKYGFTCSLEKRLGILSYDLCIEETKTVIEIDPTYTHNCESNHYGQIRTKNYHIDKTKNAEKYGYRCIHIFDWDNLNRVISAQVVNNKISAHKLLCKTVTNQQAIKFLSANYIQSDFDLPELCFGLFLDSKLLEIMTFRPTIDTFEYNYELLHLCTRKNYQILGGASKLFRYATQNGINGSIIGYCDLSKFQGNVCSKLGMKLKYIKEPAKIWSKNKSKITDQELKAKGYNKLFDASYNDQKDETLMIENGWLPVYNCGQAVYIKE